ncbi:hypothetical protein RJ639_040438 [Escallonia herrerae]|uniref:Uncharacterized protein n=1 Tax=Escallonia herrerae TaxID=1293975 RepID=A0AA88WDG3_9ASTE|nr:hypothetical protein RJ639_040438 [Escallonia herrerae]
MDIFNGGMTLKQKKKRDVGRAALVNTGDTFAAASTEPQLALIPQQGVLPATANITRALDNPGNRSWIIDSGATYHMTFVSQDFIETSQPKRTCIANANGDLRNKKIIGRGTKREGLYYMDDLSIGQIIIAHGTNGKERQIWGRQFVKSRICGKDGQEAPKTQSGVMEDDVTGSICGQEQSIQSTEEEQFPLPNSKSSPGKGLMFRKHHHLDIDGNTDADWAGNATDRRSMSGYFTFVGGNLVTWRNIGHSSKSSMNMFCNNKSAIQIAENPVQQDRTKHVEVDRHFIKEKLEAKIIRFPFVKLEEQLADILTKAVPSKDPACPLNLTIRWPDLKKPGKSQGFWSHEWKRHGTCSANM